MDEYELNNLVVTLTSDKYIDKGDIHHFVDEDNRAFMVNNLKMVDKCAISLHPTAVVTQK